MPAAAIKSYTVEKDLIIHVSYTIILITEI